MNIAKLSIIALACLTSLAQAQTAPAAAPAADNMHGAQDNTHLPPAQETHGAPPTNWNDTFVGYRYSNNFHFPGSAAKVAQNIGQLTSTGGFSLGSYYFNVDYLISDRNNPEASPVGIEGTGTRGAQETYSVGHVEWSGSKILHQHLGFGFIRDFGLTTGYEWGTKDDEFEQRAKMWMVGVTTEFAVPGYWNLTIGARNEQNYNGITGVDLHYNTAWHVDSAWMTPFNVASVPLVFKGFVAMTGPKGWDGFNVANNTQEKTVTETLLRASLLVDVGSLLGHPRAFYVGPGYEYWNHMFGAPSKTGQFNPETFQTTTVSNVGIKRNAAVLVAEAHF